MVSVIYYLLIIIKNANKVNRLEENVWLDENWEFFHIRRGSSRIRNFAHLALRPRQGVGKGSESGLQTDIGFDLWKFRAPGLSRDKKKLEKKSIEILSLAGISSLD